MGFRDVTYYVYHGGDVLGVRTNCPPMFWHDKNGAVGKFLDACPIGMEIGFEIVDGVPVEKARESLTRYKNPSEK